MNIDKEVIQDEQKRLYKRHSWDDFLFIPDIEWDESDDEEYIKELLYRYHQE